MAYFDMHVDRHWCYGYNMGVKASGRQEGQAEKFLEKLEKKFRCIDPDYKGILFDVESINFELLAEVAKRQKIAGLPDEEEVCSNLRNLRRLVLYEHYGALALLGANGRPVPYRQPAFDEKINPADERELILMVWSPKGIKQENFDLKEVLDFIYDDIYVDTYDDDIPGYRQYVTSIKNQVYAAGNGFQLGKVLNREMRHLLYCAKKEGLTEKLDL